MYIYIYKFDLYICINFAISRDSQLVIPPFVPKQVSPGGGDVSPAPCGTVLHAVAGPPSEEAEASRYSRHLDCEVRFRFLTSI